MKTLVLTLSFLAFGSFAHADASLAYNHKVVTCTDDQELSVILSADRQLIDLTVRGKNQGTFPVTKVIPTDTGVAFRTSKGELLLDDEADEFLTAKRANFLDCQ